MARPIKQSPPPEDKAEQPVQESPEKQDAQRLADQDEAWSGW